MGINTGLSNALTSDSWLIQLNFPEHLQVDEAFPVLLDCIFFYIMLEARLPPHAKHRRWGSKTGCGRSWFLKKASNDHLELLSRTVTFYRGTHSTPKLWQQWSSMTILAVEQPVQDLNFGFQADPGLLHCTPNTHSSLPKRNHLYLWLHLP